MTSRYSFNIEWSEEDDEYIATCPSFPGLSAFGRTEEEALAEGKIALIGFIETSKAKQIPLPDPTVRSLSSGKLQLRLPKSLHRLAAKMAEREEVSLNTYIADAVRARVTGEQVGRSILQEMRRHLQETRLTVASVFSQQIITPVETSKTTKEVSEKNLFQVTPGVTTKRN